MTTGWLWDERYASHETRGWAPPWLQAGDHPERAEAKQRFASLVRDSGLEERLARMAAREATSEELLRVHTERYVSDVLAMSEIGSGDAGDGETPLGPGSGTVARLAAGGVIACVEAVLDGAVANAYALVRPPGHHADAVAGMGYCVFNNTAIATRHVQRTRGVGRVAILDWDVHHGNGTETLFYEDPSVLTISLHQDGLYPVGRGRLEDGGAGAASGTNLNVPLPSASGTAAYTEALRRVAVPALERFEPELIVIASGLDSAAMDPLGRQLLHSDSYRTLTRLLMDAAEDLCRGRIVAVHEGGYDPLMGPFCGLAIVETLASERTAVVDPWLATVAGLPEQGLLPHHEAAVAAAARRVELVPSRPTAGTR